MAARSEHGLTGKLAAFVFGWEREREERKKEVKEMLVHRGMSFSCFLHLKFNKNIGGEEQNMKNTTDLQKLDWSKKYA